MPRKKKADPSYQEEARSYLEQLRAAQAAEEPAESEPPVEEIPPEAPPSQQADPVPTLPPHLMGELERRLIELRRKVTYSATVENNRWMKHVPTAKQKEFLLLSDQLEILWGGAAGPGKSEALLMAALQFVEVPGYSAIIFRKTYANLSKPGALMDRARDWLANTDATWKEAEHTWRFPSGATLTFGYLDNETDKYHYNSAEFQSVSFDELTEFREADYKYLFSRLRRSTVNQTLPIRMRAASNPGGVGHEWVYDRFFERGPKEGRIYMPATLADNPHIDREEYIKTLGELDPITREQLLRGDWTARHSGSIFKREWFQIVDNLPNPREVVQCVRAWDLAATDPKKERQQDPDWTAGVKMCRTIDGTFWILHVIRVRETPGSVEKLIYETAKLDGQTVPVVIEREMGASGKFLAEHFLKLLAGWTFHSSPTGKSGGKVARATPLACQAEGGKVKVIRSEWTGKFLDELEGFPIIPHDDMTDSASYALRYITDNCSYVYGIEGVNSHKPKQIWEMYTSGQGSIYRDPRFGKREHNAGFGTTQGRRRGGHRLFG